EESIHLAITYEFLKEVEEELLWDLGRQDYEHLLDSLARMYGYSSDVSSLILLEELIAKTHLEFMQGKPLLLRDEDGTVFPLPEKAAYAILSHLATVPTLLGVLERANKQKNTSWVSGLRDRVIDFFADFPALWSEEELTSFLKAWNERTDVALPVTMSLVDHPWMLRKLSDLEDGLLRLFEGSSKATVPGQPSKEDF